MRLLALALAHLLTLTLAHPQRGTSPQGCCDWSKGYADLTTCYQWEAPCDKKGRPKPEGATHGYDVHAGSDGPSSEKGCCDWSKGYADTTTCYNWEPPCDVHGAPKPWDGENDD